MKNKNFGLQPNTEVKRSRLNRDFTYKTTFSAGKLIPWLRDISIPGDVVNATAYFFVRMATLLRPVMDEMWLDVHIFKIPIRLVWESWQRFMGEMDDIDDEDWEDLTLPTVTATTGVGETWVQGYLGIPMNINNTVTHNLFGRSYNLLYNVWYRDQNIQAKIPFSRGDGPDTITDYNATKFRNKMSDYFTTMLPWPQKGEEVSVALTGELPVFGNGATLGLVDGPNVLVGDHFFGMYAYTDESKAGLFGDTGFSEVEVGGGDYESLIDYAEGIGVISKDQLDDLSVDYTYSGLVADMSESAALTINELRYAVAIQQLKEKDARFGTRYPELIRAHWGVNPNDGRLMVPELIGSGRININFNPVVQQSQSDTTEQGNLTGIAAGYGKVSYSCAFDEHCVLMGIMSTQSQLTYQQGMDKIFTLSERFDFFFPELQNLGEQPVTLGELYYQGTSNDDTILGYQEAWAELRQYRSQITGLFNRGASGTSIHQYHFSQWFSSEPALNNAFLIENPPMDEVLAVTDEADFYCDISVKNSWLRPVSMYSIPGLKNL